MRRILLSATSSKHVTTTPKRQKRSLVLPGAPQNHSHGDPSWTPTRARRSDLRVSVRQKGHGLSAEAGGGRGLTVVSVSGRLLNPKHCQNREQGAWPQEFSEGKGLGTWSGNKISA